MLFPRPFRRAAEPRIASRRKRKPVCESLEGRQLMSLGAEFGVSVPTPATQNQPATASSSNGSSVAVWTQFGQNGAASIMGQRFNAQGGKVGSQFLVAGVSGVNEEQPSVAMDAHGDFVVSYTEILPGGHTNIFAQKFNASGTAVGGAVPVAVGTFAQTDSSVAMDANGDFVVSYTRDTNNNNPNIFAKLYNTSEALVNVVTVAGAPQNEFASSVAMTPDGRFDVAYEVQTGTSTFSVVASQYTATGALVDQNTIAAGGLNELPRIAVDNHGNAVVAYQSFTGSHWEVVARRISNTGVLGGPLVVAGGVTNATAPAVALEGNAGAFVVAYQSNFFGTNSLDVTEVNSSNVEISTQSAGTNRFSPAVSINAQNEFLVVYQLDNGADAFIDGRRGLL